MRGACSPGNRVDHQLGLALLTRNAVILLLIVEGRPIVRQRLRLGWLRLCWLLVLRHDTTLRLLTRVARYVRTRTAALGRVDPVRPALLISGTSSQRGLSRSSGSWGSKAMPSTRIASRMFSIQGNVVTSTDRDPARVHLAFRPHWINAWFLRPLARPYTRVDGAEHTCRWNRETILDVAAGAHAVETFIRYKGTSSDLGTGRTTITVQPGEDVRVEA